MNFGEFVARQNERGALVVQPRMGFADPAVMRTGLLATRDAAATTVGTVTLDSYTRIGDHDSADRALREGMGLNGYPIVNHPAGVSRAMLAGVQGKDFPVQMRHGSARPLEIFRALVRAGLHATEGGPVSYCLPYGRTPLEESVRNWADSCALLLDSGMTPHLETFGGCMMGQLCPPSQLVALSVLEALFFHRNGIRDISVSYAQQTEMGQDQEAVAALRRLCVELLPGTSRHVVIYAYMGLYPRTAEGARSLLAKAVELAVSTGSARLIVKTIAESHRIPTIEENVAALEYADAVARTIPPDTANALADGQIYREAYALVDTVLNCAPDVGQALVVAFRRGLLDVPYCVHPDNAGRARSYIDTDGTLRWSELGALPLRGIAENHRSRPLTSTNLMEALSFVQTTFDAGALEGSTARPLGESGRVATRWERTLGGELG